MTGIKDPTKQPDLEKIKQENEQMNVIVKRSFMDIKNMYMQHFFKFSKEQAIQFIIKNWKSETKKRLSS